MEDFVTFEIAKKLNEKNYPMVEIPLGGRDNRNIPVLYDLPKEHPNWQDCKAWWVPTISQVLKWLRNKKGIFLEMEHITRNGIGCNLIERETGGVIASYKEEKFRYANKNSLAANTYEECALNAIEYVLDNLI